MTPVDPPGPNALGSLPTTIDDVGGLILGKPKDTTCSTARAVGKQVKQALKDKGFGYHKDEYGTFVVSLGHEISPQGFGIRVARAKFWIGVGALEHLLEIKTATAETLESICSFWFWATLVTRPVL